MCPILRSQRRQRLGRSESSGGRAAAPLAASSRATSPVADPVGESTQLPRRDPDRAAETAAEARERVEADGAGHVDHCIIACQQHPLRRVDPQGGEVLAGTDPHAGAEDPGEVERAVPSMCRQVGDVEGGCVLVREVQHGGEPVLRTRGRERDHIPECTVPAGRSRRVPSRNRHDRGAAPVEDRHRASALTCWGCRGPRSPGPCSGRLLAADQLRGALTDQHRGDVGVHRDQLRHDRAVDHAQARDALDP